MRFFREQIGALLDGGVNLIMFETFTTRGGIAHSRFTKKIVHHCPAVCCSHARGGALPSGMTWWKRLKKLRAEDCGCRRVNCLNGPQAMVRLLEKVPAEGLISAYRTRAIKIPRRALSLLHVAGLFAQAAWLRQQGRNDRRLLRHRAGTYRGDGEGAEGIEAVTSKTIVVSDRNPPRQPSGASRRRDEHPRPDPKGDR